MDSDTSREGNRTRSKSAVAWAVLWIALGLASIVIAFVVALGVTVDYTFSDADRPSTNGIAAVLCLLLLGVFALVLGGSSAARGRQRQPPPSPEQLLARRQAAITAYREALRFQRAGMAKRGEVSRAFGALAWAFGGDRAGAEAAAAAVVAELLAVERARDAEAQRRAEEGGFP